MRFLFVDRILQLTPGHITRGIKHITRDDAYLCSDEKGKLCFMSSLIGETLGQLAAWNVMSTNDFSARPVAGIVSSASLHRCAYVGETLLLESVIESLDKEAVQYHSNAWVNKELVFSIEGALGPLVPMQDFIDEKIVRRQFAEIHRPGDWPPCNTKNFNIELHAPSNSTAKASLLFDRILDFEPKVSITAEKRITLAAPYFADHFPNNPVLPLTVLLEAKLNLAREFVALSSFEPFFQIKELRKIKMSEFVYPGAIVKSHLKVKEKDDQQLILTFRTEVDGKRVCVLELIMKAESIHE